MGHPGAVEAVAGLTGLVLTDLLQGGLIGLRVTAVGDERRHAADRRCAAAVAGPDQLLRVRPHHRGRHGHVCPVREHEVLPALTEVLDDREDVVPAAGVQPGGVVAQLVEDLLHLERGGDGLDQHGGADGALRDAQGVLGHHEDAVPQPCLEVVLGLGEVEVWSAAATQQLLRVVEEVEAEVHQRTGHGLTVHQQMVLLQMPAAGPHDDRGPVHQLHAPERVLLALGRGEVDLTADGVLEVHLSGEHVLPGRCGGVLEVGQPALGAGVQSVDRHLPVHGAGDLHAAVLQSRGQRGHPPRVVLTDGAGLGQEPGGPALGDPAADLPACLQQLPAAGVEAAVQHGQEVEGLRREDLLLTGQVRTLQGHSVDGDGLIGGVHGALLGEWGPHDAGEEGGECRWRPGQGPGRHRCSAGQGPVGPVTCSEAAQWNCPASVEPASAVVELSGLMAVEMASK